MLEKTEWAIKNAQSIEIGKNRRKDHKIYGSTAMSKSNETIVYLEVVKCSSYP
jgi:hypothetical protein